MRVSASAKQCSVRQHSARQHSAKQCSVSVQQQKCTCPREDRPLLRRSIAVPWERQDCVSSAGFVATSHKSQRSQYSVPFSYTSAVLSPPRHLPRHLLPLPDLSVLLLPPLLLCLRPLVDLSYQNHLPSPLAQAQLPLATAKPCSVTQELCLTWLSLPRITCYHKSLIHIIRLSFALSSHLVVSSGTHLWLLLSSSLGILRQLP